MENIPILPVGIIDFCKQKLLAPPMKPMNHLKSGKSFTKRCVWCNCISDCAIIWPSYVFGDDSSVAYAIQGVMNINELGLVRISSSVVNQQPIWYDAIRWVMLVETLSMSEDGEQEEQEQEHVQI